MIYSIRLTIKHCYDQPAANGRHLIRVLPTTLPGRQYLKMHLLDITPEPYGRSESTDFFGNSIFTCTHRDPHRDMKIRLDCRVEVKEPAVWNDRSPRVTQVCNAWKASTDLSDGSPLHFLGPTARLAPDPAIEDFARGVSMPHLSTMATVVQLGQAIYDRMTFDDTATTVDTDASEAFRLQRGVCQDFTHIMILGLQALGIPAGYVSGYLRTIPPEGGVRLEGVDAMHAWVRAWCGPDQGWIEYDPTNATLVGADHIVVGYGRDYTDVSPVRGHLRSSGGQTNSQAVDVEPLHRA
ncbi:MAG: transglutaminase family protein [Pseudomonadota bacterium]